MYKVGDTIIHPLHGAGRIVEIVEEKVFDSVQKYYVVKILYNGMKVLVPVKSASEIGIRNVISEEEANRVFELLKDNSFKVDINSCGNYNKRIRENQQKLKSGNIYCVVEVLKMLAMREKIKGLSTNEKMMFNTAKQILVSELGLAKGLDMEEVERIVDSILFELETAE
ncbi:transcriptional regulator, CarD family [Caldicellulosiruptor obsidiansis OB47]|uniref:Transcriptional regulator, CarD family n=1 Tax=Caldicellulosiruptor obsidiansis (strain ATCC BAA-2073 / JCM 16842 / OB47) TaxID=608506 RepID=D9TKS1_CALOO|nr:CarD family transcriptional regulator [Caldicellulosiruptor obsidiansis]ADL42603.1 transcriptional regulator, CarD family [Caldicellulosiruptor obsidiansis OB47]